MAKEITIDQHKEKIITAFGDKETLSRKELIAQLRGLYGVGGNKIEEKGGYLSYLMDFGLIVNNSGVFRKGTVEEFKMPISAENWDAPAIIKPDVDIIIKPNIIDPLEDPDCPF